MSILHKRILLLLLPFLFLQSCQDNDDTLPEATNLDVQNFIWKAMNQMYLWQAEVPNLADNRFASNDEYSNFLEQYTPEELFENLLHRPPSLYSS
ncbi:MAG TPA: hypothetical protein VJ780_08785, partial [Flavobacterium sp.]|nr:hypothetical protein [Flavobacterium sp.]